ncbi:MAG: hypothetical protein ACO3K8_06835 [Pseudohongiellaceae bacterium]
MKTVAFISSVCLFFCGSVLSQTSISGVWLLNGPGTESAIQLTPLGEQIRTDYDLLVDDPSLSCTPASVSRIWANPNSRIKITEQADAIEISYELFDLRRHIPLGDDSVLSDSPSTRNLSGTLFAEMGSSFAFYEGTTLIIESRNHAPGYIRTSRGIPQSPNTVAIEEIEVRDGELHITHTYRDESLFEVPLVLEYSFRRIEAEDVDIYSCTDADYDWFLELNNKSYSK